MAVVLALVLEFTRAGEAGAGAPTDALRDFFGAVNVVVNDPRTADQPLEKLRAIRRHVDDMVDFREAARLALGREWHARTPLEQNEFVALFADLLERSFVWRVAGKASLGGGVRVDYLDERASGDAASVETAVAGRDGNTFPLEFRMVRRGERWVVRDIVMDGVSTMENYHAQFQRIVRDTSWRDLVAQLRAKVGAPAGGVQVAAAAPVVAPPAPARGLAPLPAADADRPGADLPHAIARDVAAAAPAPRPLHPAPRDVPAASGELATAPRQVGPGPREAATAPGEAARAPGEIRREAIPASAAAPARREAVPPRVVVAAVPAAEVSRPAPAPARVAVTPPRPAGTPRTAAPTRAREGARPAVWIQVGAFRSAATAGRVATQVQGEILVVPPPATRAEPLLRVRVGPFPDRARATARLREIRALGYQPFLAAGD